MKIKIFKKLFITLCLTLIIINSGCLSFKNVGNDLGEGLIEQLKSNVDTIGYEIIKGMRESITSEKSKQELANMIDTLINRLGYSTNKQLMGLRDSLLNDYLNLWVQSVVEDAIGNSTRSKLGGLRDELLGDKTVEQLLGIRNTFFNYYLKEYLSDIERQLVPNLFNDSATSKIFSVRDTLLGIKSNSLIKSIVDTAMVTLASRLDTDINPRLQGNLSFIQKNASWLIILIGAVTIFVAWFLWRQKEKYLRLTKLLTYQISELPSPNVKEELKNNISKNAKMIGTEDDLRSLLASQGILHKA